jgi:hypothetical protein
MQIDLEALADHDPQLAWYVVQNGLEAVEALRAVYQAAAPRQADGNDNALRDTHVEIQVPRHTATARVISGPLR